MTKNMYNLLCGILASTVFLTLAGCGGGGDSNYIPPTVYTSAVAKVKLNGELAGKAISGAEFTMTLPANVTPASATGFVTPTGTFAGSTIAPIVTYIPASGPTPGTVHVVVSSSVEAGVATAGEVATVMLHLANGATPTAPSFSFDSVATTVIDTLGNPITGMTASVAGVTLQ
ncbi:MAG TPA: hypothetical protein HPP97_00720 [Desulfuromonadales bacterium]|nr:hypothetical protein [Desulfuromonadales bacterium]